MSVLASSDSLIFIGVFVIDVAPFIFTLYTHCRYAVNCLAHLVQYRYGKKIITQTTPTSTASTCAYTIAFVGSQCSTITSSTTTSCTAHWSCEVGQCRCEVRLS